MTYVASAVEKWPDFETERRFQDGTLIFPTAGGPELPAVGNCGLATVPPSPLPPKFLVFMEIAGFPA